MCQPLHPPIRDSLVHLLPTRHGDCLSLRLGAHQFRIYKFDTFAVSFDLEANVMKISQRIQL
jgi:hypothetical protein